MAARKEKAMKGRAGRAVSRNRSGEHRKEYRGGSQGDGREEEEGERQGGEDTEVLRPPAEVGAQGAGGTRDRAEQQQPWRGQVRVEEREEAVNKLHAGNDGDDVGEGLLREGDPLVTEEGEQRYYGCETGQARGHER